MAAMKGNDYFGMFLEIVDVACNAAEKLLVILQDFHPETLEAQMEELHAFESEGDERKHRLLEMLAKEFVTPIEREDIMELANELDNVIDSVEDVLLNVYMYNIRSIQPAALEFARVIEQCCKALRVLMREFASFRKSKLIVESIIEINRLEETGDRLYLHSVRSLYEKREDPFETTAWTEVYNSFEKCCDTCEHVADVVESVIMGNT